MHVFRVAEEEERENGTEKVRNKSQTFHKFGEKNQLTVLRRSIKPKLDIKVPCYHLFHSSIFHLCFFALYWRIPQIYLPSIYRVFTFLEFCLLNSNVLLLWCHSLAS